VIGSPANNALYETSVSILFDGANSTGTPYYNYTYPITSYLWTFGDGATSTQATARHAYTKGGMYTVTLTIVDYSQATAQKSIVLYISPPAAPQNLPNQPMGGGKGFNPMFGGMVLMAGAPTAVISGPSNNALFNTYAYINFDGSRSTGQGGGGQNGSTITSYKWTFGDGQTATGANAYHTYAKAGQYTVTLTVTDSWQGTASTTITLFICPPPAPQNIGNQPGAGLMNPVRGGMLIL
jgi:PKD repeat protein